MSWVAITDDPPQEQETLLWLTAEPGSDTPIGPVIASYKKTSMGAVWVEKSVAGNLNTGLRSELITHYKILEDGPNGEHTRSEENDPSGPLSLMG